MRLLPIAIIAAASVSALTIFLGMVVPAKNEERPLTLARAGLPGVVVIGLARQGRRR